MSEIESKVKVFLIVLFVAAVSQGCEEQVFERRVEEKRAAEAEFFNLLARQSALQKETLMKLRGFSHVEFEGTVVKTITISTELFDPTPLEFSARQGDRLLFIFGRNLGMSDCPKEIIVAICNSETGDVEGLLGFRTTMIVDDVVLDPESNGTESIVFAFHLDNNGYSHHAVKCKYDGQEVICADTSVLQVDDSLCSPYR